MKKTKRRGKARVFSKGLWAKVPKVLERQFRDLPWSSVLSSLHSSRRSRSRSA